MKIIMFLIGLLFIVPSHANQNINIKKLTVQQAEMLVSVVKWRGTKNNPCVIFYTQKELKDLYEKAKSSRFLDFMVGCRASNGDAFYSVDLYTGDIFNTYMECSEINNKKLKVLQKKLRQSLYLTDIKYCKIKTKGPMCDE